MTYTLNDMSEDNSDRQDGVEEEQVQQYMQSGESSSRVNGKLQPEEILSYKE